ncbi:MAG: hypothetical protein D6806_12155 [Deltaproteobacteria bacterium]|nr:MAG: hypothetical protein D6806_12155 [Deltaproteobacteria bacterium]
MKRWLCVVSACIAATSPGGCVVFNDSCPVVEQETWGWLNVELDIREQFVRQCEAPVGNLIADAMANYPDYGVTDEQGLPIQSLVALINAGAIRDSVSCGSAGEESRASIPRGPVTNQDFLQLLPFQDSVVVASMTGTQLKQVLEWGVSALGKAGDEGLEGHFLQIGATGGIKVTVDCGMPEQTLDASRKTIVEPGQRITGLEVFGQPYIPDGTYHVAVLDFMVGTDDLGVPNDGFASLQQPGIRLQYTRIPLTEVVRVWLQQEHASEYPKVEGRMVYQNCDVNCSD